MSTKEARSLARKARKLAPANMYDFARNMEKAIEELADELEVAKKASAKLAVPTKPFR